MLRFRFCRNYLIYFPLAFFVLALLSLFFIWIVGCPIWNIASVKVLDHNLGSEEVIENRFRSLKQREERLKTLVAEIESVKRNIWGLEQGNVQNMVVKAPFDPKLPYIYAITPTYKRLTQKADLTRLCQTFLHVSSFHWIIVEDAEAKTKLVETFLVRCGVEYTHLAVKTSLPFASNQNDPRWLKPRGVEQRNAGLTWLRQNIDRHSVNGVVYFVDDDNTYDLEIFKQMRATKKVSIWPVALVGGLKWEGPVCKDGKVVKFHTAWDFTRSFPIDMAGFAINLKLLLEKPSALIDINAPRGHLESSLLKFLVTRDDLEPLADNCKKILVWHTQTADPKMKQEDRLLSIGQQSDPSLEV